MKLGSTVLYVKLLKVLYGWMETSLLCDQKLLSDMEAKCFKPNTSDACVAKKRK